MDWEIFWLVFAIVLVLNMFSIAGFLIIDKKIDRILEKMDTFCNQMENVGVKIEHVEHRISKLEGESKKKPSSVKKRTYSGAGYVI